MGSLLCGFCFPVFWSFHWSLGLMMHAGQGSVTELHPKPSQCFRSQQAMTLFLCTWFCGAGDWTRALCMWGNTANQPTCSACIMSVLLVYMLFICHGPGPVTCQLSGMRFFRSQGHHFLSSLNSYPTKISSKDSNIHLALTGRVLGLPYAYKACL